MSSLCGSDGTTWAEDDLTTPSSIATLSRSRRTSSPHDPSSDAFLLRDDLETLSLLLCMAPSRIWADDEVDSSSEKFIGQAPSRAISVHEALISSKTSFLFALKLSPPFETDSKWADLTSSDDCCAIDILCIFSRGEWGRPVFGVIVIEPISSFSPVSNSDSALVVLSIFTARFTIFSITSHTESDTGESSSIRSKFCKMLKRFTPCGLLLTWRKQNRQTKMDSFTGVY